MSSMATTRRPKWQYPSAPPTPRILYLPRRPRRKPAKAAPAKPTSQRDRKGKLEVLFDQERSFSRGAVPVVLLSSGDCEERRERVVERESEAVEEEKWRFQAEMLRAECNLLRMEREIAVKKMERRRAEMERALRSSVQILVSARKKIYEGKNASMVLEEEIEALAEKLDKLQKNSRVKNFEIQNCSNFDKQVSLLQRQLDKFGGTSDDICVKEIQEMAEASFSIKMSCFVSNPDCNVEILRRKMEGLSKGMLLERMEEEYGSMLSTANSSAASSASTSKRIEIPELALTSIRQPYKETCQEEKVCSGRCKAVVRRIVEQVRAETEQWSQMQEMLGQVRNEMEELQASRDFWEDRALDSDYHIQSLHSAVQEWRQKALSSEAKTHGLQSQIHALHKELKTLKKAQCLESAMAKNLLPCRRELQNETEKRVLICHPKQNYCDNDNQTEIPSDGRRSCARRSPFRDIGNVLPLEMEINSKSVFPLHCPYRENNY